MNSTMKSRRRRSVLYVLRTFAFARRTTSCSAPFARCLKIGFPFAGSSKREGFTLIEILAALVPAAILVLTVGVMLFYAWRAWVENQAIVELQQDGAAVMAHIAHAVRIAGYTNVTTSTGQIEIQETNGVRRFVLDAETERLLLWTPSGGAPSPVTQQRVTRFEPLKEGEAAMRVEIVLGPPDGVITQQALFHSRN